MHIIFCDILSAIQLDIQDHCSLFTKILILLANPGKKLHNQLAGTEIHSPKFFVMKNNHGDED